MIPSWATRNPHFEASKRGFGIVIPLLFHHLVCIGLPIPHSHFHQILPRC